MNNYPYIPGNYNPQQYQEEYRKIQLNRKEKREFRKRSTLVALGAVIFILVSFIIWRVLFMSGIIKDLYNINVGFSLSVDALVSVFSLFGAYIIIRLLIDREHKAFIPLALPENKKHALLLIPVGVLSCIAGAFATFIMNSYIEDAFNVTFTQPEIPDPKTPVELGFYLMASVLVPCIFEEIALRAGALEAMRKYGDWFAIITSAFIFAILHGNMIQTPFAFIAGIAIGYIYVATGSIWPGVIIHFINNLSTCSTVIGDVFSVEKNITDTLYGIYTLVFVIGGIICLIIYLMDKKRPKLNKDTSSLTFSQKLAGFVFNVPMIASIIYMGLATYTFIERGK